MPLTSIKGMSTNSLQSGWRHIVTYDYQQPLETAVKFMTAHAGCLASPFITAAVLGGAPSAAADYGVSVLVGMTTMLSMDALIQHTKVDQCMRCINSKLDGFKRQGKTIAQAVMMSSFMYFGHHLVGHHPQPNHVQKDSNGNEFIVRMGKLCGTEETNTTDTIWVNKPQRKLQ